MGLNDMPNSRFFYSTSSAAGENYSMNSPVLAEWAPQTLLCLLAMTLFPFYPQNLRQWSRLDTTYLKVLLFQRVPLL